MARVHDRHRRPRDCQDGIGKDAGVPVARADHRRGAQARVEGKPFGLVHVPDQRARVADQPRGAEVWAAAGVPLRRRLRRSA